MNYTKYFNTRTTPQSSAIPGTAQVMNNAGGFGWELDKWGQLDRFLILGAEGGTYYVSERKLTVDNANSVLECIKEDGPRVVRRVVEISEQGRAPKNDPALFVLAMASAHGDTVTRRNAFVALSRVARIGTHLLHFAEFRKAFGGWGRGMRTAVSEWFNSKDPDALAYQLIKYPARDGWSMQDLLRKAHPTPRTSEHQALFAWVAQGEISDNLPEQVKGLIAALENANSAEDVIRYIEEYNLPREAIATIGTEWLSNPKVLEALLYRMPVTALVRNLGNLGKAKVLTSNSEAENHVVKVLEDEERLLKSRIHPLQVLAALNTYRRGKGFRGSGTWTATRKVVDALDEAFYTAFGSVEPTNKRTMLALDVSGSMAIGHIAGAGGITPRMGSAAMALVTARVESDYLFTAFSDKDYSKFPTTYRRYRSGIIELSISPRQRLDDVIESISGLPFQGTDCALPMLYALENNLELDTFVVYTDSETWAGDIHPVQALNKYRQVSGIPAKLVVVGMVSNGFTIADPNDAGMLDVVGFDTATPNIISQFSVGM